MPSSRHGSSTWKHAQLHTGYLLTALYRHAVVITRQHWPAHMQPTAPQCPTGWAVQRSSVTCCKRCCHLTPVQNMCHTYIKLEADSQQSHSCNPHPHSCCKHLLSGNTNASSGRTEQQHHSSIQAQGFGAQHWLTTVEHRWVLPVSSLLCMLRPAAAGGAVHKPKPIHKDSRLLPSCLSNAGLAIASTKTTPQSRSAARCITRQDIAQACTSALQHARSPTP